MRLLLLRHGQTHGNVAGALDTAVPGLDLTDLGRRQAAAVVPALGDRTPDAVYVSSLARTHQTAAPLAQERGLAPTELDSLREVGAGDFEMATDRDSVEGYLTPIGDWIEGRFDIRMPGGESGHEFLARYDAAIADIAAAGHHDVLLVSHGAAIRTWVAARTDDAARHAPTGHLHNTGFIEVHGDPKRGWAITEWHTEPIGGAYLEDVTAPDPTGHAVPD